LKLGLLNTKKIIFQIASGLLFCVLSCNSNKSLLDKEFLLSHYHLPEDSLKRESVTFLLENMTDQVSEIPVSKNLNPFSSYKIISDNQCIGHQFLIKDIDNAFELWNKYPWADHVPFEIFLNYLLPYKIYREEPADWRTFFMQKYQDTICSMLKNLRTDTLIRSTNDIYYRFLVNDVGQWFVYQENPVKFTPHPGLNELMTVQSGNCHGWSYLNVMILRSLGIPSSIDNIPLWGRKNGSHSTEVFWDNANQKFRTPSGREVIFPAKVFRYTYKIQNAWADSIKPVIRQKPFLLDFLKHNHWIDVTHEHTQTATVNYPCDAESGFAYICVCNYGKWLPVYWGEVNNGKACFKNMGTDMLYRIAIPRKNSFEVISPIFLLDSNKNKIFFKPIHSEKINLQLSKLNTGSKSWVEKNKNYNLYYSDKNSNWILFKTQKCETDSLIIFEQAPSHTLYLLQNVEEKRRLERIFTYEDGKQVFW
jgi:hypothetical protein